MSDFLEQERIILASQSSIRQKLLENLGVVFEVIPSHCDEESIKTAHPELDWPELGIKLANAKALTISHQQPDAFVIAADQLCILDDMLFNKPIEHQKALSQLKRLSGKKHLQIACCSIAHQGKIVWSHHSAATLWMRHLSEQHIESYLLQEQPYHSCGSYQFEGPGKWLFERVEGQEDIILGLPLMPLAQGLLDCKAVKFKVFNSPGTGYNSPI